MLAAPKSSKFNPWGTSEQSLPALGGGGMVPPGGGVASQTPQPAQPTQQYGNNAGLPHPSVQSLIGDNPQYAREDQLRTQNFAREDQMRTEDRARKDDMFSRIKGLYDSAGSTSAATVQHDPTGNAEAARGAAFARAKEQAGQTARASMTALNDVVAERGLMGSTVEAGQAGQVVGQAGNDVNSFTRDQLESDLDRSNDVADQEYQGGIAQRGQDLNRKQALLGLLAGGGLY